jgi:translocation and assembly module TamB
LIAFPLERIRRLGNSEVRGTLNGEFELEGLHRDARANLRLETQQLRIRDLVLTAGSAQVVVRPGSFDARVRLEESPAFAEARLSGASTWGESLVPVIDDSRALRAGLSASRFRIATLLPFAGGVFSDLDGRLDSEMSAEIDRRARTTRLSGVAALKGGVFELAAGGGEFHDVDAKLVLKPDGTVQLESMTAQGVNGRLRLTASARFDGLGWASSEAHLLIPANSPIPLTLEGAGYGTVFGQIDLLAVRAPNQRDVLMDIDVPTLNVMLPATSTRTVRQLEPMKDVRLGSRQSGDQFVPLPTRRRTAQASVETPEIPAQVKISLNLGKEIKVTRGNSLEVTLTGRPQLVLTNSVDVSGQLQLLRGFLDIEGKRFEIEQGTVSFVGKDPTNPQADVTATWTAPDGTIVYAEFSGPLRTGRVTLRSDPPLPSNEILALMLFGGTDLLSGSSSSQARASGSNVIGVAQGAATQPINHALQDYGLGGVSTRVDTSAVNPRPEVEVRIARDIALQIAWVLGTPPPGSNPDRTLFTIDWQFFRRWSLETTVGDAGTSIADVIWQYGY